VGEVFLRAQHPVHVGCEVFPWRRHRLTLNLVFVDDDFGHWRRFRVAKLANRWGLDLLMLRHVNLFGDD